MTENDIIPSRTDVLRMAREAGFEQNSLGMTYTSGSLPKLLERFAALVAAASASVERETCAKVLDEMVDQMIADMEPSTAINWVRNRAAAIRSRSSEHCARRDVVTYGKTTSKERSMGTVSGLDIANNIEQEWRNKCEAYMKLMDAHAKELDRAMDLLHRAETVLTDNYARKDIYDDIKEFLK